MLSVSPYAFMVRGGRKRPRSLDFYAWLRQADQDRRFTCSLLEKFENRNFRLQLQLQVGRQRFAFFQSVKSLSYRSPACIGNQMTWPFSSSARRWPSRKPAYLRSRIALPRRQLTRGHLCCHGARIQQQSHVNAPRQLSSGFTVLKYDK